MIRAERLAEWDSALLDFADPYLREMARKYARVVDMNIRATDQLWLVKDDETPVLLFGAAVQSLMLGTAYVWILPFSGLSATHAKACARMFGKWVDGFTRLEALVVDGDSAAERFAEFFKFQKVGTDGEVAVFVRDN